MEINKNSWHYRLLKFLGESYINYDYKDPTSLCSYFWFLIGYSIRFILMTLVTISTILVLPLLLWFWLHNGNNSAKIYFIGIIFVFSIPFLIACIYEIIHRSNNTSMGKVVFNTVKAYKNKVCPIIKYTE